MTLHDQPARIEAIDRVSYRLEPLAWRFEAERAEEIDAHWQKRVAANPHLFNGRVLLMQGTDMVETQGVRHLAGACFLVSYKSFIAWRDFGFPDRNTVNVFAMAALRSSDGGFLLGEMGPHTAAAGRIYFPAGTPDENDLRDGCLDLEAGVCRELQEETGLGPKDVTLTPGWTVVLQGAYVGCMKAMTSTLSAKELVAQVGDFLAREKDPELTRLKPVFSARDLEPQRMPAFVRDYLRHVWAAEHRSAQT